MAAFLFRSLESTSHFRILYLNAGADGEQLSGSLIHHNLDRHPTYDCLSYVWGCPTLSHSVLVNGVPFPVTANLYCALKRIRARSSSGRIAIWADGICINQDDVPERNQQVNLMRRIYSECQTALLYLGEEADGSDLLPDFLVTLLCSLNDFIQKTKSPTVFNFKNIYAFPEYTHPGWKILKAFLGRPFFRRVWTVQEFALPPHTKMICGQWEMPGSLLAIVLNHSTWSYCPTAFSYIVREEHEATFTTQRLYLVVRISTGRDCSVFPSTQSNTPSHPPMEIQSGKPLVWLLDNSRSFLATDPRDKIFALLPLSSDAKEFDLIVDYTKTMETITVEVLQHLIHHGYGLSLLLSAGSPRFLTGPSSWCPNWTSPEILSPHEIWPTRYERIPGCQIISIPDTQMIKVIGSIVATVQDKGVMISSGLLTNEENKWIQEVDALVAGTEKYPTGKSVYEAVWRTLIADRTLEKQSPAPELYANLYREARTIAAVHDRHDPSFHDRTRITHQTICYELSILIGFRFSTTSNKLFCMLPTQAEVGDSIFVVKGDPESATFLVRKDPVLDQYRLIGHAYVYGIWDVLKRDDLEDIAITIY